MDAKPCPSCGGILHYEVKPGTRDNKLGPSLYCDRCLYREWGERPTHTPDPDAVKDEHQSPDWKLNEYERRSGQPEIAQITAQIGLGDIMDAWILRDRKTAAPYNAILNVCQKDYSPPEDAEYVHIPLTEYGSRPAKQRRREADFERAVEQLEAWVAEGKKVFVHCVAGANRSASVVMAYLMHHGLDFPQALGYMREKRPAAWPHGELSLLLRKVEQNHRSARRSARVMRAGDGTEFDPAEFVAQVDWDQTFDENYDRIRGGVEGEGADVSVDDMLVASHPDAERFVRADILISQALDSQEQARQPLGVAASRQAATSGVLPSPTRAFPQQKMIPRKDNPRNAIQRLDPTTAYSQVLSRRGLVLPAPHIFKHELVQAVYQRAPLIPLDFHNPASVDQAIAFVETTRGVMVEAQTDAEAPQEYYRVPTDFGSLQINHIVYSAWFAIFSANTSVEGEETQYVMWQCGQSGEEAGKPGIMCKKPKILEWLRWLKRFHFPDFGPLYQVLDRFNPSDESYGQRMIALAHAPGMQFKTGSLFLGLLGDERSPTLDMHANGHLIESGKRQIPAKWGLTWTPLNGLLKEEAKLSKMIHIIETSKNPATVFNLRTQYTPRKQVWDKQMKANKEILKRFSSRLALKKGDPPPSPRGKAGEKKKVEQYIGYQMEWNGNTDEFWVWFAKNKHFKSHEPVKPPKNYPKNYPKFPLRMMIHSVFFMSLFPQLFTPEALQQRELVQEMGDPETWTEEQEDRAKYRDAPENLEEVRKIQPHMPQRYKKHPRVLTPVPPRVKAPTPPADDFDWGSGNPV